VKKYDDDFLRRFADCYEGSATDAGRAVGLDKKLTPSSFAVTCSRLMKNPFVIKCIEEREFKNWQETKVGSEVKIASRKDRQAFWTSVMYDENAEMKDRIAASALLGKSEQDFIERVQAEIKSEHTINIQQLTDAQLAEQAKLAIELLKGEDYAAVQTEDN
jgi:phage terminase small subunit